MAFQMPYGGRGGADSGREPPLEILLQQAEDEEADGMHATGFVMWPSAVMLSRWLARNPSIVLGGRGGGAAEASAAAEGDILELGAGCGLVGLTAAALLRRDRLRREDDEEADQEEDEDEDGGDVEGGKVIFTDYNPAVLENLERNLRLNRLDGGRSSVVGLDFFDQSPAADGTGGSDADAPPGAAARPGWIGMDGTRRRPVRLVLAAEILCYSNDAALVAGTLEGALCEGGRAILLGPDSTHRFGVEEFPEACRNLGLTVRITDRIKVGDDPLAALVAGDGDGDVDADVDAPPAVDRPAVGRDETLMRELEESGYSRSHVAYDFTMFTVDKPISAG